MPMNWESFKEPNLLEMMKDPIIQALMQYDGIKEEDFPALADAINNKGLQSAGA